jgi:hypothetical protein
VSLIVTFGEEELVFDYDWETKEEGVAELRRAGCYVTLDVSRVPLERRDDPQIPEWELIVSVQMRDEWFRTAVCLHEAAHAEYMERRTGRYVEFVPPHVFVKSDGELTYSNASVTNPDPTAEDIDYVKEVLAAGIAEDTLLGRTSGGTGHDERDLREVFAQYNVSEIDQQTLVTQARQDILKDLRSPQFRKALWARARFYKRVLEQAMYGRVAA